LRLAEGSWRPWDIDEMVRELRQHRERMTDCGLPELRCIVLDTDVTRYATVPPKQGTKMSGSAG
jgi:hypothetical protein